MLPPESDEINERASGWRANDLTPADVAPLAGKFAERVVPSDPAECWIWRGHQMNNTYGGLSRPGRRGPLLAHRVAWVLATGEALTGQMTIDHLCNERLCVNPAHLEPVTMAENQRRKIERRGYVVGGARLRRAAGSTDRPRLTTEAQKERNRKNALAYYYANRERILAEQRRKGRPQDAQKVSCVECGVEVRRDSLRRHAKRKHGAI